MQFSIQTVNQLLNQALEKAGAPRTHAGLRKLDLAIRADLDEDTFLSQKYLYDYVLKRIEKAEGEGRDVIGVNPEYLDFIARYIGFDDIAAFDKSLVINQSLESVFYFIDKIDKAGMWYKPRLGKLTGFKPLMVLSGPDETFEFRPDHVSVFPVASQSWLKVTTDSQTIYLTSQEKFDLLEKMICS